jgi:hypothetical protein
MGNGIRSGSECRWLPRSLHHWHEQHNEESCRRKLSNVEFHLISLVASFL